MRRIFLTLVLMVLVPAMTFSGGNQTTVTGRLIQVMAIGGETTGWAIRLDKPLLVSGKALRELEVDPSGHPLDKLRDRHVKAKGALTLRQGVERGSHPVLQLRKIWLLKR